MSTNINVGKLSSAIKTASDSHNLVPVTFTTYIQGQHERTADNAVHVVEATNVTINMNLLSNRGQYIGFGYLMPIHNNIKL